MYIDESQDKLHHEDQWTFSYSSIGSDHLFVLRHYVPWLLRKSVFACICIIFCVFFFLSSRPRAQAVTYLTVIASYIGKRHLINDLSLI